MEPAIRRTLRQNIRNRRLQLNMSQEALANAIGVTQPWIALIESPNRTERPNLDQVATIAEVLKCQPYQLLTPDFFTGYSTDGDDLRGRR